MISPRVSLGKYYRETFSIISLRKLHMDIPSDILREVTKSHSWGDP
jgi:hypothetical protein